MINKIDINGVHTEVTDDLRKYVVKKISRLEKYIPRHARESVHVEVKLKEGRARDKNARTCEVLLHLPHETVTISETTINMFAAVDIVEEKLKTQLHRYKERHANPALHQRLILRLKRSAA